MSEGLPVAIVGAGPVGLAAAAHLVTRGLTPLILEQGSTVGATVAQWRHVRMFTPWSLNIDVAARALLAGTSWSEPDAQALPTGGDIVDHYLEPLARHPAIAPHVMLGARLIAVTRRGFDKLGTKGREAAPFVLRWRDREGLESEVLARAVIDASGTWLQPNPMGIGGLPVEGEATLADGIEYGIPDVFGDARHSYAGKRTLVVGSGYSAINVILDLLALLETAPGTGVIWALRGSGLAKLLGGGLNDALPARGALGVAAVRAIKEGRLEMLAPFAGKRIARTGERLAVAGHVADEPITLGVDRIVVATGFRPDTSILRELRVALDPIVEAPPALAPLIDPNLHSCGTVPPHGAVELAHPEPGLYIVGAKSYGRAPTFLLATGYEQARSVVAEIAGDHVAARRVELLLPETGVCSTAAIDGRADSGCCGVPVKAPEIAVSPSCCGTAA